MTSISKNLYIEKLEDIVHKYNNKKHRTIKMKTIDVKDNTYIEFGKELNDNDPKFIIADHVRISKYKNIFVKDYTTKLSEEVFVIKKLKIQFHEHMSLMILMVKKLQEYFMKKSHKR